MAVATKMMKMSIDIEASCFSCFGRAAERRSTISNAAVGLGIKISKSRLIGGVSLR